MKKLFTLMVAVALTANMYAQSPSMMSYQAVVRNSSDVLVQNTSVGMQISILQGSTVIYTETQIASTNTNGLVSIQIGGGNVLLGDLDAIDWSNGPYFIKTETDINGGSNYTITGVSQLLSVPFAMHAKTATSASTSMAGDSTTNIATTAFVTKAIASTGSQSATTGSSGSIRLAGDLAGAGSTAAAPIISDSAITTNKIKDMAITQAKIGYDAVGYWQIANNSIGGTKIVDGVISNSKIANKAVTSAKMDTSIALAGTPTAPTADEGDNSTQIATTEYVNTALTAAAAILATPDATTSFSGKVQLAGDLAGTASAPVIAAHAVDSSKIADGAVTLAKIAPSLTQYVEISSNYMLYTNHNSTSSLVAVKNTSVASVAVSFNNSGGYTMLESGETRIFIRIDSNSFMQIAADAVSTSKIVDAAVTSAKMDSSIALTGTPTAPTAAVSNNSTQIATTAFVNTAISDAVTAVATPDATTSALGKIQLAGDLAGTASAPVIAAGVITSAKIADGTIVNADLDNNSVANGNIMDSVITSAKLAPQAVATSQIVDGAVTSLQIADETISNGDISTSAAIGYGKLNLYGEVVNTDISGAAAIAYSKLSLANSIATGDLADGAVTTGKLGNNAVTTGTIADEAVTYAKLNISGSLMNGDINSSAAIGYSKLNLANSITSTDLTDGAVTSAKLSSAALQSIAGLSIVADRMIYTTATNTYASCPASSIGRGLLGAVSQNFALGILGLGTSSEPTFASVTASTSLASPSIMAGSTEVIKSVDTNNDYDLNPIAAPIVVVKNTSYGSITVTINMSSATVTVLAFETAIFLRSSTNSFIQVK